MNTLHAQVVTIPDGTKEECARFTIDDAGHSFEMTGVMTVGRTYTFSCWVRSRTDDGSIAVQGESFQTIGNTWLRFKHTFEADSTDLVIAFTETGIYDFYHTQLEIGNKATDWTPAVEDMRAADKQAQEAADIAQGEASDAYTLADDTQSVLEILNNKINMLVESGVSATLLTQTDTGWEFNMGGSLALIEEAAAGVETLNESLTSTKSKLSNLQGLVDNLADTFEYVRIGTHGDQPCIELGESDSDFKLCITNTQILFMEGTKDVAYINDESLFITKAEIVNELRLGDFVWVKRDNGNLGLIFRG